MSNFDCEVCNKKIKDPLYWADPKFYDIPKKIYFCDAKFYDIPKKIYFCDAKCSLKYYEKIKKLYKNP